MLERVVEEWLDKSNERNWQQAFCTMLLAKGHTILHSTRHNAMELGVDVLSVDTERTLCAYQLKGTDKGTLRLRDWREISSQLDEMVCRFIEVPGHVGNGGHHRSFLVTNGQIDETARQAIIDRNRQFAAQGTPHRKIETIVRGQMLADAISLGTSLWPTELEETRVLLEFLLDGGNGPIPLEKLSKLLEPTLAIKPSIKVPKSKNEVTRRMSAGGLLTAIAISNFSKSRNYWAEISAWTMFACGVMASAERKNLKRDEWQPSVGLAITFITASLDRLYQELKERGALFEGNSLYDAPYKLLNVRITYLCGAMAWYWLWRRESGIAKNETDEFVARFIGENRTKMYLWGEGAIPFFLAVYFFFRNTDATKKPDEFLATLLRQVVMLNQFQSQAALAQPFVSPDDVLSRLYDVSDETMPLGANGSSYTAEVLLHFLVRRNWKQTVATIWPEFSKLASRGFVPAAAWEFLRWRNLERGAVSTQVHTPEKHWSTLQAEANAAAQKVPQTLRKQGCFILLFAMVFPHRLNTSVGLHIDEAMTGEW